MTCGLMRRVRQTSLLRIDSSNCTKWPLLAPASMNRHRRWLASIRETDNAFCDVWFSSSAPVLNANGQGGLDCKPPDERTLKLGKTIRILHERLPTLLASPLPQEILSPQITLYLFPSTHPHLPTVSGRIAYTAALWTAPVVWGRLPVVGNVKLVILSERMFKNGNSSPAPITAAGRPAHVRNERLVVRWKTCGKEKGKISGMGGRRTEGLVDEGKGGQAEDEDDDREFSGLFIFEFDEEGRIVTHTIEHAEEGGSWDKMTRVISVTDWLLGKAWGKRVEDAPGLALGYCDAEQDHRTQRSLR